MEIDWGTDIYIDRQIVAEKLALASDRMPQGIRPQLAPIASIMGQIMHVGMWSEGAKTDPLEVRTLADWVVRQRLLTIPGVAQVITMGGGRKQFQVLLNPELLVKYDVTLKDVERAVATSNANATGGYLNIGSNEYLVRGLGRLKSLDELNNVVVNTNVKRPVLLRQVARIIEGAQVKRGDSAVNGEPAVILTISKQPGIDTRTLTDRITAALADLQPSLPTDIRINTEVYQQKVFIELSIRNIIEALREGSVLVVIILFLFLLNFRTTFITLTAIPLSLVVTGLVFKWYGMSINTMTLGGLAVAMGELTDAAVVTVENIFRRLRENRHAAQSKPPLRVVYEASSEVRNSLVFGTILVVLVCVPLFALSGIEGRLFVPLAVAYIVSILASLLVSLTVTPVLSYWLLPQAKFMSQEKDGFLLRWLKWIAGFAIRFSVRHPWPILGVVAGAVAVSVLLVTQMGRDFLPPFNEGSVQVNVLLPPGTSLETSNRIAGMVEQKLAKIKGVVQFGRRTGRAELDEHAEGVNVSEIIVTFDPKSGRTREQILEDIREDLGQVPGQQAATRMIGLLSLLSLAGMFLTLYMLFQSVNLSLQVLAALPIAAIGAVAALLITRQSLTVASMVGFISLCGIASRNGIQLISHYLHLVRHEGERFTPQMIERAGQERVAPILMTAFAGIGLVPLVLASGEPGKEILYPVATVVLGGLVSSTLLDFFVRPSLFWCFGRKDTERQMQSAEQDELYDDVHAPLPPNVR